jgi:hypothetical protein
MGPMLKTGAIELFQRTTVSHLETELPPPSQRISYAILGEC